MSYERFLFLKVLVFFGIVFSACQKNAADSVAYSKIENVDFKNFSYTHGENDKYSFTLVNGETPYGNLEDITFILKNIKYEDLTNDNEKEAIIDIFIGYGGSSTASLVYIYTLKNKQPKKLWYFNSGYNANGGLKNVFAEEDNLIIELFGDNKFEDKTKEFQFPNDTEFPQALCCPNHFTKFIFKWNEKEFVLVKTPELIKYDWKNEANENLQSLTK